MRYIAIWLLVFGIVLILTAPPAHSDHQQILPGVPTKVMNKAIERGYVTYRLDANTSAYPNFRTQANAVALAGLAGVGIEAIEVFEGTPDIWLTMPDDQAFLNTCGQGAAGCILYTFDPIIIYFRRSLLYFDWKTTIAHEGLNYGHAMGQHEGYYDSDGQFRCKPLSEMPEPSVMSCGTGIWQPQPFDIRIVHSLTLAKRLSSYYGMSYTAEGNFAYYCDADRIRGRRVAVMARAPDGNIYWTGNHMSVGTGCFSIQIISEPGWCFLFNVENGFNWKRGDLRNDTEVGCV